MCGDKEQENGKIGNVNKEPSGNRKKEVYLQGRISAINLMNPDSDGMTIDVIFKGKKLVVFLEDIQFNQIVEENHETIKDLIGRQITFYNFGQDDEYFDIRSREDEFLADSPIQKAFLKMMDFDVDG